MGLDLPQLIKEIKEARQGMEGRDAAMAQRFDALTTKYQGLEEGLDALHVRLNRPGGGAEGFGDRDLVRKSAREYVLERRAMLSPKDDGGGEYEPRGDEIDSAIAATKALRKVIRYGAGRLDALETKSLSEFNFGSIGWVLPSQWSSRVLSCLVDGTDLTSYVAQEGISGPSLKLAIDNLDMGQAAWACETSCFANNSQPNLAGLGEMEIKAESLRFAVCSTTNLLEDSAIRIEEWLQGKVANAFRDTISCALIVGDGIGRPQGLLHPSAGIPVCDTSPNTPAGTFTWQDLIMLAFEVPMKWQGEAVFLMNQKTLALCLTLSDGIGRPVILQAPVADANFRGPRFTLGGWPIIVASQMPDVAPGSTPILFGNLRETYLLVLRKGTTMLPENVGWCRLFRFETRVGGGVLCANAARLLRVK